MLFAAVLLQDPQADHADAGCWRRRSLRVLRTSRTIRTFRAVIQFNAFLRRVVGQFRLCGGSLLGSLLAVVCVLRRCCCIMGFVPSCWVWFWCHRGLVGFVAVQIADEVLELLQGVLDGCRERHGSERNGASWAATGQNLVRTWSEPGRNLVGTWSEPDVDLLSTWQLHFPCSSLTGLIEVLLIALAY